MEAMGTVQVTPSPFQNPGSATVIIMEVSLLVNFAALANGDAENSLVKAEKLMKTVAALTEKDLPGKQEYVASLHSCIGNAHLEMGEAELALENHLKDLAIAEKM